MALDHSAAGRDTGSMIATISDDGQSFTLTRGAWSNTYPLSELPKWQAFYHDQKRLFPKAAESYDASIAALDGLAQQLAARG